MFFSVLLIYNRRTDALDAQKWQLGSSDSVETGKMRFERKLLDLCDLTTIRPILRFQPSLLLATRHNLKSASPTTPRLLLELAATEHRSHWHRSFHNDAILKSTSMLQ